MTRILILGASGMLGNAVLRDLVLNSEMEVVGTVRAAGSCKLLPSFLHKNLLLGVDVTSKDSLVRVFAEVRPDVVINCVGLVKQLKQVDDPLQAIPINSVLPHRLANISRLAGARLIHFS